MATRLITTHDILDGHVGLDIECLDRIYLNGYVPNLQVGGQVVQYLAARGFPIPSPAVVNRIGERFRESVRRFAEANDIAEVRFKKGDRKIDVMSKHLARQARTGRSGVAAIGTAQEFQWVAWTMNTSARVASSRVQPLSRSRGRPSWTAGGPQPLRFGDPRVISLAGALAVTSNLIGGFSNKTLRPLVAGLLGESYPQSRCCYDLRRLRMKGLITRIPHSNTYVLTDDGQRFAIFYTKIHNRLLRPLLAANQPPAPLPVRQALRTLENAVHDYLNETRIAA